MQSIIEKLEYVLTDMEELPENDWEILWPQAVKLANLIEELRCFERQESK